VFFRIRSVGAGQFLRAEGDELRENDTSLEKKRIKTTFFQDVACEKKAIAEVCFL
jgi:hypothetical protein